MQPGGRSLRGMLPWCFFILALLGVLSLFGRTEVRLRPGKMQPELGLAFEYPLGGRGDSLHDSTRSTLRLFEDGRPLGPAHAVHSQVREEGRGAFSHWENILIFSTSDNSDPRGNGRAYAVRLNRGARLGLDPLFCLITWSLLFLRWRLPSALDPDAMRRWCGRHAAALRAASSAWHWLAAAFCLAGIGFTWYLRNKGFFNNDTGIGYTIFEHGAWNPLLAAAPQFVDLFPSVPIEITYFRKVRFVAGLLMGGVVYASFARLYRRDLAAQASLGRQLAYCLAIILVFLHFPLHIITWPFGHHDLILWACGLLISGCFLYPTLRSAGWRAAVDFFLGAVSGLSFFAKPTTGVAALFVLGLWIWASQGTAREKLRRSGLVLAGGAAGVLGYFCCVQDPAAWVEMVARSLRRIAALEGMYGDGRFSMSLLDRGMTYVDDIWRMFRGTLIMLDGGVRFSGRLFVAFLAAMAALGLARAQWIERMGAHALQQGRRWTLRHEAAILRWSGVAALYVLAGFLAAFALQTARLNPDYRFADLSFLMGWCLFFPTLLYWFHRRFQDVDPESSAPAPMRTSVAALLLLAMPFVGHAGSSDPLYLFLPEVFFVFLLLFYVLMLRCGRAFRELRPIMSALLFAPFLLQMFNSMHHAVREYYGSFQAIADFQHKLDFNPRTCCFYADTPLKTQLTPLHDALVSKTDYQFGDLMLGYPDIALPVYLLGGDAVIYEETYPGYLATDYYLETTKAIHGDAARDMFVLVANGETAPVKAFLQRLGVDFDTAYRRIAEAPPVAHESNVFLLSNTYALYAPVHRLRPQQYSKTKSAEPANR